MALVDKKLLKKGKKTVAVAKENCIRGQWKASEEYNAVLDAIHTLSVYATKGYAKQLHDDLNELNMQMIDIEHYVEIEPVSNEKAHEIALEIKGIMSRRRDIQQQLQLINRVHECRSIDNLIDGHIEPPSETVEKKYNPRSQYGMNLPWSGK